MGCEALYEIDVTFGTGLTECYTVKDFSIVNEVLRMTFPDNSFRLIPLDLEGSRGIPDTFTMEVRIKE